MINRRKILIYKRRNDEEYMRKFNSKLRQESWMSVINVDVNIAYDNFLGFFLTYYEEFCPVEKVYLKDTEDNPWITTSWNNACKKKKLIYKISLK